MKNNKEILLIDGTSLIYKSFFGTINMLNKNGGHNSKGEPINALRAFGYIILKLQEIFKTSDSIFIAFDSKEKKTDRHQYDFYKAQRPPIHKELVPQIQMIYDFLDLYGIKWDFDVNFEADDLVGMVAKKAKLNNYVVNIITTDKDFLQLVDENVTVFLSKKGATDLEEFNLLNFAKKFNLFSPTQIPDFKGIAGDKSDNIEGIKGIGPQTAIKLLNEYNNLETLLESCDELPKALGERILANKENAILSKDLATIKQDGNFKFDLKDFVFKKIDYNPLIKYLKEKEVFNLSKRFENIE